MMLPACLLTVFNLFCVLQLREWELVKMKFGVDGVDQPVHLKLEYSLIEVGGQHGADSSSAQPLTWYHHSLAILVESRPPVITSCG